jgi:hypothetical protein
MTTIKPDWRDGLPVCSGECPAGEPIEYPFIKCSARGSEGTNRRKLDVCRAWVRRLVRCAAQIGRPGSTFGDEVALADALPPDDASKAENVPEVQP